MNIVSAVTKDCASEKCTIQVLGGMTTLAYQIPIYDKRGNQFSAPAVNTTFYAAECMTCGRSWRVSSKGNEVTATLTPAASSRPLSDRHALGE